MWNFLFGFFPFNSCGPLQLPAARALLLKKKCAIAVPHYFSVVNYILSIIISSVFVGWLAGNAFICAAIVCIQVMSLNFFVLLLFASLSLFQIVNNTNYYTDHRHYSVNFIIASEQLKKTAAPTTTTMRGFVHFFLLKKIKKKNN